MASEKGKLSEERIENMQAIAEHVIGVLKVKNPKYGESWKQYGGFSAFMNTARKWSRAENLASKYNYDIFAAFDSTIVDPDGMRETLLDLVGYLLLVLDDRMDLGAVGKKPVHEHEIGPAI